MNRTVLILIVVVVAAALVAFGAWAIGLFRSPATAVTGTVTYMVRSALPPDAVVTVEILDVSLVDAPSTVIGQQIIDNPGQVPIAYEVPYDPGDIAENRTYSMSARIADSSGALLFISDTFTPVITQGAPTENVEIMTVPVNPSSTTSTISGNVTYLVRSALPPDAVTTVQLIDVSLADAPAVVLGEQRIVGGQVPIPYTVAYDPTAVQPNHSYSMSARITDAQGQLLFISDTIIPVLTNGAPSDNVEIMTVPVAGSGGGNSVTGTVTSSEAGELPPDAILTVEIQDVSLADAPAAVIGRETYSPAGQMPIAFDVPYDPGVVQENNTYSMEARITDAAGTLLFISDTFTPVITRGNPTSNVQIAVVPVAATPSPTQGTVSGTVTFAQPVELPPSTLVLISVQDVSRANAPATMIGSITISAPGAPPIPYEVGYDASQIDESRDYTVSARVTDAEGTLLFTSDTRIPVITKGNPVTDVEIPVVPVQ